MHKAHHKDLDQRINEFITRKTAPKNLSQIIADHLIVDRQSDKPRRTSSYELLPIRRQTTRGH